MKPKAIVNDQRIQPIDPEEYGDPVHDDEELKGSYLVRNATKMQERFVRRLDEESEAEHFAHLTRKVWVVLNPVSGEASLYPPPAATRLEGAFQNNRASVPLTGLGSKYEDLMVHFGDRETGSRPLQRSITGEQEDVRRFETPFLANEVCLHVKCDNDTWRVVDEPIPGTTEERRVALTGYEITRLPSPRLPRLDPSLRSHYICAGGHMEC
jgi:hypothetical protein